MKKVLVLMFCLILILIGCSNKEEVFEISFTEVSIVEEGLKVVITTNIDEKLLTNIDKISIFIIDEKEHLIDNAIIVIEETFQISKKKYEFIFKNINEDYFSENTFIKVCTITNNNSVKCFNEKYICNLYNLAKESNTDLAKYIVLYTEGKIISEIILEVDYKDYIIEAINKGFKADIKTDYIYVTITVTIDKEYQLIEDYLLIINGEIIEDTEYNDDNTIIIEVEDPNWTDYY